MKGLLFYGVLNGSNVGSEGGDENRDTSEEEGRNEETDTKRTSWIHTGLQVSHDRFGYIPASNVQNVAKGTKMSLAKLHTSIFENMNIWKLEA